MSGFLSDRMELPLSLYRIIKLQQIMNTMGLIGPRTLFIPGSQDRGCFRRQSRRRIHERVQAHMKRYYEVIGVAWNVLDFENEL